MSVYRTFLLTSLFTAPFVSTIAEEEATLVKAPEPIEVTEPMEAREPIQTRGVNAFDHYDGQKYDAKYWVLKGLEHNFTLQIGRMESVNADDRVTISLGSFSPSFSSAVRYSESERAQNRQEFLATDEIDPIFEETVSSLDMRLEDRLTYGTQVSLSTITSRLDNTTNRNINTSTLSGPLFHPEYQTVTQLQVIQPLLKNRGVETNLAATNLAISEGEQAEYQLLSEMDKTIAQILIAFAETEFGVANLAVKEEAVQLAEDLVEQNQRRVEEGVMSGIDVTQAEARRAEAMEQVVGARTFLAERRNRLLELTGTDYTFGQEAPIRGSVKGLLKVPEKGRIEIGQKMLAQNPIYLAALEKVEAEGIRVSYAENQLLPQLDLEGTVGTNGLDDSFFDSYDDFSNRGQLNWSLGLVFSVALDRSARSSRLLSGFRLRL